MATKKKVKRVQSAKSKVQSHAYIASLEKQIAALEEHIAALQTQVASDEWLVASKEKEVTSNSNSPTSHSPLATSHSSPPSPLPQVVYPLAPPSLENVTAIGSRFIRVSWIPVPNASGYVVRYSPDSAFVNNVSAVTVNATDAAITLSGLEPDTTYYVGIMATGEGSYLDSPFSVAKSAKTGVASNDETVTHFESWLTEQQAVFQNFATLLPQLDSTVLTTVERRRLHGSGVRRYGYADKVSDVAKDYPQFWPASADLQDHLKTRLREIEALRNLLVWSRFVNRVIGDLLLLAGDDAFRMANTYYSTVRAAARSHLPEAQQVFQMLNLFWQRPRRTTQEPSIPEVERDVRALLRGTKEGSVFIENESDSVTKGKRTVVDNTRKVPKAKRKAMRSACRDQSEELSTDCADVADDFLHDVV